MGMSTGRRLWYIGWLVATGCAAALLVFAVVWAQDDAPPSTVPPPATEAAPAPEDGAATEDPEKDHVYVERADKVRFEPDPDDPDNPDAGIYYLSQNVHIRHKDMQLFCDECVYNIGKDTGRALGNLRLVQPDTTVTGDLLEADFDQEVAVVTGNVRLVTQKKEEGDEAGQPAEGAEAAAALGRRRPRAAPVERSRQRARGTPRKASGTSIRRSRRSSPARSSRPGTRRTGPLPSVTSSRSKRTRPSTQTRRCTSAKKTNSP